MEKENIFKNAKFGDKFVTRDGMPAIFLDREIHPYIDYIDENNTGFVVIHIAVSRHVDYEDGSSKDYAVVQAYDEYGYRERFNHHETEDDIASKYKEPINEEELADIKEAGYIKMWFSKNQNLDPGAEVYTLEDIKDAIDYGYRKAREE